MARFGARKKETYRERWLREHPRISLYLRRDEYERLKSLAESKGSSIKQFILSLIEGFDKYYGDIKSKAYEEGYREAIEDFAEYPQVFYEEFKEHYPGEEPLFYTYTCSVCGKPVVSNHKSNSARIVRETLKELTKQGWGHACCHEVRRGKRKTCPHISSGL